MAEGAARLAALLPTAGMGMEESNEVEVEMVEEERVGVSRFAL